MNRKQKRIIRELNSTTGSSRTLHILSFWIEICFSTDKTDRTRLDSRHHRQFYYSLHGFRGYLSLDSCSVPAQHTVLCASAYVCTQNTRSFHSESTTVQYRSTNPNVNPRKVHRNDSSISLILLDPMILSNVIRIPTYSKKFFLNVTLYPSKSKSNERINNAIFRASIK